ncbi:MAG: hypothetical protein RSB09_01595, partial [Clostridia bacterium]
RYSSAFREISINFREIGKICNDIMRKKYANCSGIMPWKTTKFNDIMPWKTTNFNDIMLWKHARNCNDINI